MAKLTKKQKKTILGVLLYPRHRIQLKCDNDIIELTAVRANNPLQYKIGVYVNGSFNVDWLNHDKQYPEQKYLYVRKKCFIKAEHKKFYLDTFGREYLDNLIKKETYTLYHAFFPNSKSAISHLCKVCEHIEIITDD